MMNISPRGLSLAIVLLFSANLSAEQKSAEVSELVDIQGEKYLRAKYRDLGSDAVYEKLFDMRGVEVVNPNFRHISRGVITPRLKYVMSQNDNSDVIWVTVNLDLDGEPRGVRVPREKMTFKVGSGIVEINVDGKPVVDGARRLRNRNDRVLNNSFLKKNHRQAKWRKALGESKYFQDENSVEGQLISEAIANGRDHFHVKIKKKNIRKMVRKIERFVKSVDSYSPVLAQLDSAMQTTGIEPRPYEQPFFNDGAAATIFIADTGCDPTLSADSSDTELYHSEAMEAVIRRAAPEASIRCSENFKLPSFADFSSAGLSQGSNESGFDAVNLSAQNLGNNPLYVGWFDDFVYNNDIPIFAAAGNKGDVDTLGAPGNSWNVITVGAHGDDNQVWTSSEFHNPTRTVSHEGASMKPEITANGIGITFPGSDFTEFGRDANDPVTGTSPATALATGMYALFSGMELYQGYFSAALAKSFMISSAKTRTTDGARGGEGGLRYHFNAFAQSPPFLGHPSQHWSWSGGPNGFNEEADGAGRINIEVELTAGDETRGVLAWLNRGSYAEENKDNINNGLGRRLDLRVLDPNGNQLAESGYLRAGYQIVDFIAPASGTYLFEITEGFRDDVALDFRAAFSVNRLPFVPSLMVQTQGGGTPVAVGNILESNIGVCIDTDGDGWGWNGQKSCEIADSMGSYFPVQDNSAGQGDCIDADGDGWGWDGVKSCIPDSTATQCIDTDGDGWGWDGSKSCRSGIIQASQCIDTDGDGYGWNGVATCSP